MKLTISFCLLAVLLFAGCVSAHKKGRTIHELKKYQPIVQKDGTIVWVLVYDETWMDEYKGGGVAVLTDPTVTQFASTHTNQTALGGGSALTIGSAHSEVSTNGIIAVGSAINQAAQGIGSAVGQAANKAVTGTPVK